MKKFKHWLKIDGKWGENPTKKAWNNVEEYLKNYPESKITIYLPNSGNMFSRFICLESMQSYDDLDIDCNSSFNGSLIKLNRKPSSLELTNLTIKDFLNVYAE